jgi:hypothetical protein
MAEGVLDIADLIDEDPKSRAVRIDARKWIAAKLKPGTYGDTGLLTGVGALSPGQSAKLTIEFVGAPAIDPPTPLPAVSGTIQGRATPLDDTED